MSHSLDWYTLLGDEIESTEVHWSNGTIPTQVGGFDIIKVAS